MIIGNVTHIENDTIYDPPSTGIIDDDTINEVERLNKEVKEYEQIVKSLKEKLTHIMEQGIINI